MSRRTILISALSALGGAMLVGGILLAVSLLDDGDEGGDADPRLQQVQIAAEATGNAAQLGSIAAVIANGQRAGTRISNVRDQVNEAAAEASAVESEEAALRPLMRANDATLDVLNLLGSINDEMSGGRAAIGEEQEASEEASERLAGLSESTEGVTDRVQRAKRRTVAATTDLEQAVAILTTELEDDDLSEQATAQLATVQQNLGGLRKSARSEFDSLSAAAESLATELSSRSEELEPDVILDCPQFGGVYEPSVRNMTCAEAEPLISEAIGVLAPSFSVGGFSCSILGEYGGPEPDVIYGADDVRCESGDQAFRFDFSE